MISHLQAQLHADIDAISDRFRGEDWVEDEEDVFNSTSLEVSAALSMTRRAAEALTGQVELLLRLPQVWEALDDGRIDLARARIITDVTSHLPHEEATRVADIALERAPVQTTGQLRARLARLVISTDPAAAKERYEQRLKEQRVECRPGEDGTAHLLGLNVPPDQANAAMRRLSRLAKKLKAQGDKRPIDQIRADLYMAILTGRDDAQADSQRGVVDLKVDLTTLAGLDESPAEIPGWGPVIADIARKVAHARPSPSGAPSPPIRRTVDPALWSRPNEDPQQNNAGLSKRSTPNVCSPRVGWTSRHAMSTTRSLGQKPIGPPSSNWSRYAGTTTSLIIEAAGS
jgi:hypothetical protein